jgi:hypothetical protein
VKGFIKTEFYKLLLRLASNWYPPDLCLLNS